MKKHWKAWGVVGVSVAVIIADQLLKSWCETHLWLYQFKPLLGQEWLQLTRVNNLGMIGDRFSGLPRGEVEIFIRYVPLGVLAVFAGLFTMRWRAAHSLERLGALLIVAGGISNLWNHWTAYHVVDTWFLATGFGRGLSFNLADLALVAGVGAMLLAQLSFQTTSRSTA